MTSIIVDTSALIAFFVRSEKHHQAARQYVQQNPTKPWIVLETVTWLRIKVSIVASIQIGKVLRQEHVYVNLSVDDDNATWKTFAKYNDKYWSYTDCSMLAMAQRLNVSDIFSFDNHISQMASLGINCVP